MALCRLDKLISDAGASSRREAKALVRAGRVLVDGRPAVSAADRFDPEAVSVTVDGVPLGVTKHIYLMLNKPAGVLSATEDPRSETVLDLLPEEHRRRKPFPVGRLDKDTTGLLLLTDDGAFAHRVISPRHMVPKLYEAEVDGVPAAEDVRAFEKGLVLSDGTLCLPARLEPMGGSRVRVEVFEGRYHQVKRMLASRGLPVVALRRLRIGALWLDATLMAGESRLLGERELDSVFRRPRPEEEGTSADCPNE